MSQICIEQGYRGIEGVTYTDLSFVEFDKGSLHNYEEELINVQDCCGSKGNHKSNSN